MPSGPVARLISRLAAALHDGAAPSIPRIVHQTWKTWQVPSEIYDPRWVASWTQHHPDWLYVLWTDERLRALGRACYPEFELFYREGVPGIYLADFGRYMVLHRFGGLYVDLDYECFRSLEPLLAGHRFVTSHTEPAGVELNNALIAACPGHPLLRRYLEACARRWREATRERDVPLGSPGPITGPEMMTEVSAEFVAETGERIQVHEARLLCPIDWRLGLSIHRGTLTPEVIARVQQDYPGAYAATYWTHAH
jgi:mannosyltransferase OCH1-like enzyme